MDWGGTSYFNAHSPVDPVEYEGTYYSVSVPKNGSGYQYAHTGVAYAAVFTWVKTYTEERGYIADSLISPLISGTRYYVTFYVSLADSFKYACNNIGAYFSKTRPVIPPEGTEEYDTVPYTPQISNDTALNPLTDKVNWMKVSGSFVAAGGEQYILIGNFVRDAHVDLVFVNSATFPSPYDWRGAYYYIDDVIVSPDSTYADSLFTGVNEVKPVKASVKVYPNPANNLLNVVIDFSEESLYTICLYNSQGEKVICESVRKGVSLLPITTISSGMYLYRILDSEGNLIKSDKVMIVH